MALNEALRLVIEADARGAVKGLESVGKSADKNLGKTDDRMKRVGAGMQKVGVGMVATGALVVGAMFKAAMASEEAEQSTRKLQNSIKNSGQLASHSVKEFTDLAEAIQSKTAADADDITAGIAVLAQGELQARQIKELTPLVVDLARKKGIDEVTAFTMASKAVAGSTGALKKAGIQVDENRAKTDAYGATVDALRSSVGGFAEEEGKTFAGSLQRLKNELGDIEEGVGKGAVEAFTDLLKPISGASRALNDMDPQTQATIGKLVTFGSVTTLAAGGLSVLTGKAIAARAGMSPLQGTIAGITGAVGLGVTAWSLYTDMMEQARRAGEHSTDGLKDLFMDADPATVTMEQLNREIHNLTSQTSDMSAALAGSQAPWDADAREQMRATIDEGQALTDQWVKLKGAAKGLAASHHITGDAALQQILANKDLTDSIVTQKGAVEDDTVALEADVQVLKDRQDALRALVDPQFAMLDAIHKEQEARVKLAQVQRDKKSTDREEAQAQEDLTKAVAGTDSAALSLTQSMMENGQTIGDVRAVLDQWVASGRITAATAKNIGDKLEIATAKAEDYAGNYTAHVGLTGALEVSETLDFLLGKFSKAEASRQYAKKIDPTYSATGGMVDWKPRGADTVPAMLSLGEGVVNPTGMNILGESGLNALNAGRTPAMAGGDTINIYGNVDRDVVGEMVHRLKVTRLQAAS